MEVDESQSGKQVTCTFCHRMTDIPQVENVEADKPRLKVAVQKQAYENISESAKICPQCNASSESRAVICVSCGFNFVAGKPKKKRGAVFVGWLFGSVGRFVLKGIVFAVVLAAGFVGFVWFQNARFSQEIRGALEKGDLATVTEDYRKLASYYRWFEYVGWPNPYELRWRQFQARADKTYEQTRNAYLPLYVERSVWGNRDQINMKVGWVKFRLVNLREYPLEVSRQMFLLMGLETNVALANELREEDPKPVFLAKGEGMKGVLYFAGIVKQPAFLEFNTGMLVVRAPTYYNWAIDNYERDHRDWPAGKASEEFPMLKLWEECRMTAAEVNQLWQAYNQMPPPPAEPYTTVLREQNPR